MRMIARVGLALGVLATASGSHAMTGPGLTLPKPAPAPITKVEYFCSPGFVPTTGGRCVAVMASDQIELYVNEPIAPPVPHRHRRHALHARY